MFKVLLKLVLPKSRQMKLILRNLAAEPWLITVPPDARIGTIRDLGQFLCSAESGLPLQKGTSLKLFREGDNMPLGDDVIWPPAVPSEEVSALSALVLQVIVLWQWRLPLEAWSMLPLAVLGSLDISLSRWSNRPMLLLCSSG